MRLLFPQFLWLLGFIPGVILLHFLRAKPKLMKVSALFLWHEAKSLAQKRRRFAQSWLLILQILAVVLAALALARPHIQVKAAPDRIIIVDASASMLARDSEGERLARAIQEARDLIADSAQVGLIRAGLEPSLLHSPTNDKAQLIQSLENLNAGDSRSDLKRALGLAKAISPSAQIEVFSDQFQTGDLQDGELNLRFHLITGDAYNIGINAFELRAGQAFVSIVSNHPRPQELTLKLYLDDALVGQSPVFVPAEGQIHQALAMRPGDQGVYQVVLEVPDWDGLSLDNEAFSLNEPLKVLLAQDELRFERALSALEDIDILKGSPLATARYDLVISDKLPAEEAQGYFLVYRPKSVVERPLSSVADWDASHPLLRFVDLRASLLRFERDLPKLENAEWQVLAEGEGLEPLIAYHQTSFQEVLFLNFHPDESDLVRRSAFPILIANVVNAARAGKQLPLGSQGITIPGVYELNGEHYSLNLFNQQESQLIPSAPLAAGPVAQVTTLQERQAPLALWLLALLLVTLLAEWLLFNLRHQGMSKFWQDSLLMQLLVRLTHLRQPRA
ncbi:MAG: BatA and WFA domain-containing protein [Deinococcales bacterium]